MYQSILLWARIFIDCERCNSSTSQLGCRVELPMYVSLAAMVRLVHPTGKKGIVQACSRTETLHDYIPQCLDDPQTDHDEG